MKRGPLVALTIILSACTSKTEVLQPESPEPAPAPSAVTPEETQMTEPTAPTPGTFGDDAAFLKEHTQLIVLSSADGQAQVAVAPEYQGRVMTSTASGAEGASFGWIHRPVIEKHARQPHMTVLGGEDRFWLGPEGGQFGLYFQPGAPFEFEHWQVPEPIDWGAFDVVNQSATTAEFAKAFSVKNHAGTEFQIRARRTVRLLDDKAIAEHLAASPGPGTKTVAFESDNVIENAGKAAWKKETGLVSIWILSMFTPSPQTVVAIPIEDRKPNKPVVRDDYFGSVPPERLAILGETVLFKADGRARGKIGIAPAHALPVAGSFDGERGVLTIVQFTLPSEKAPYVDSRWAKQADPYAGDVTNSYNDGPPKPGEPPLGPFYEIESSSPGAELAPGGTLRHVHRVIHLQGPDAELDAIAKKQLGVGIAELRGAFASGRATDAKQ